MADVNTYEQRTLLVTPKRAPAFDAPNLLVTTLAVVVATMPFGQRDWPVPAKAKAQTHTIAQARPSYYSEGKPFHQDEWPTPPRLKTSITLDSPNLMASTLAPVPVVMPFSQAEWPLVLKVKRPTETIAQARPAFYSEGKPAKQDTWPTPLRLVRGITFEPPNLLHGTLTPVFVAPPFVQSEWITPPAVRRAVERGWTQAGLSIAVETVPLTVIEWPTPPARRFALQRDPDNLTLTLLAPVQPFALQRDWPLPRVATRMALTWVQARPSFYEEPANTATADVAIRVRADVGIIAVRA